MALAHIHDEAEVPQGGKGAAAAALAPKDALSGKERLRPRVSQARIAGVLARHDLASRLASIWFWLLATAACLIAAVVGSVFVRGFETETVLVAANPLAPVDALVLTFLGVVLGMRLAASLAWEREHRTLEVLLCGPARLLSIVTAKFAAELIVLVALLLIYSAYVVIARPLGTAVLDVAALGNLWTMAPMVLPMIALGLLIAAPLASVRLAVMAFLLVLGVLGGIEALGAWLDTQSADTMALAALYLRAGLRAVREWLFWLSPVAYAADVARGASGQFAISPFRPLAAAGLSIAGVAAAVLVARRRGVA